MEAIIWQQFGLQKDPYNTLPLIEGGDLAIDKAFIGRGQELNFLNNLFLSYNSLALTICGDVGVGKTSLANFQKYIYKHHGSKLLFSFRREIEVNQELLNKRSFLLEIIGSFLREIKLLDPDLLKIKLLNDLNQVVNISRSTAISGGISALGFGVDYGQEQNISQPNSFPMSVLEDCFVSLIKFIKNNKINNLKYSGLIIHVNNFDVVMDSDKNIKEVIRFFNEIRDLLQTSDTYFLFLGPKNFFKDIINTQKRVKSIFYQTPLQVKPLSKKEIIKAFDERLKLLQSSDVKSPIKPIEDEVIYKLYDLYEGDIRSIMAAIKDILGQCSSNLTNTICINEAMLLLSKERWHKIDNIIKLTSEQKDVLKYLAHSEAYICQQDLSKKFNKAQSNISGYYLKPLKDSGIIEVKEKKAKTVFYGLSKDYIPLKWLSKSQQAVRKQAQKDSEQLKLF